jgi:hypothetical protein
MKDIPALGISVVDDLWIRFTMGKNANHSTFHTSRIDIYKDI